MINSCKASQSELFPTKYIGRRESDSKLIHVFAPKHQDNEYKDLYENLNELYPIYLESLDQLDQYILTEENGDWFEENLNQNKSHYSIKSGVQPDCVLSVESVIPYKWDLGRFRSFEKLLNLPNDPLPPIRVRRSGSIYEVVDGHHRLEYSILKGYPVIPVCVV